MNCLRKLFLAVLFAACCWGSAPAQLYVGYYNAGVVSKFNTDTGEPISENFILGLKGPRALCLADGFLYIVQQGGVVGKYDPQTGAAINERLISGLNMPQAIAVSGRTIYLATFGWAPPEGGMTPCHIGTYDAVTGAAINDSFIKTDTLPASLAVSGRTLFVAGASQGMQTNLRAAYDTSTGAPVNIRFAQFLNGSVCLAQAGNWLWFTIGANAPYGSVFKFNVETGDSAVGGIIPHPLVTNLNYPSVLAVSGADLFVGGGRTSGTSISKYNSSTGALIKAAFIRDLSDRFGGIAAVPKALSADDAYADTKFATKNDLTEDALWIWLHGDYLYYAAGLFLAIAVLGLSALFFFKRAPELPVPAEGGMEPEPTAPPASDESTPRELAQMEEPAPAQTPAEPPRSTSPLTVVILGLVGITLVLAAVLAWLASQAPDQSRFAQPESSDLIGIWGYENNTRRPDEEPILLSLFVHPALLEFSTGNGMRSKMGKWHDNGFWCQKPDGSGEVEVARLLNPEELELHRSAFDPGNPVVNVLYKEQGSAAEMQAIAAKYPPPITYPPPAGVIKYWMTEYTLTTLPWKADHIEQAGDDPYSRGIVYVYRSDNPHIDKLRVTVKNHHVVEIKGGNG